MIGRLSPYFAPLGFGFALVTALGGTAAADPTTSTTENPSAPPVHGKREVVVTPLSAFTPHEAKISPFLYLNRCSGGCTIHGSAGTNDARTQTSSIPNPGTYTVGEFQTGTGLSGTAADAEWQMV